MKNGLCLLLYTAYSPLKPFFTHDFILTEFWSDLWSNGWCSVCFHLQSVCDFIRSIVTDIKVSGSGSDECSFYQLHLWKTEDIKKNLWLWLPWMLFYGHNRILQNHHDSILERSSVREKDKEDKGADLMSQSSKSASV